MENAQVDMLVVRVYATIIGTMSWKLLSEIHAASPSTWKTTRSFAVWKPSSQRQTKPNHRTSWKAHFLPLDRTFVVQVDILASSSYRLMVV
jgi:hypothetical protein